MTLMRRERFEFPEMMRRFLDKDAESGWLRVEEFRDGDMFVVRAEMPGIDPEKDVEISVEEDMLHIQAEKEEKSEHKDKDGYRSEFRYGSFSRDLPVPHGTKAEDVKAEYHDGVLDIRVPMPPMKETAPAAKVAVTRS
jgi:HSP20 family protein